MSLSRVPIFLGIAGAVPFVLSILGFVYTQDYPKALSQHAFMIYSLAILCFLAGTTWGMVLNRPEAERVWPLLVSNGVVLFAVAAMLTANPFWATVLLGLAYFVFYLYERFVLQYTAPYQTMRRWLTVLVVLLHALFAAALSLDA